MFEGFESTMSSQVLSADVNRLYLKALITCRHWDKFFIKAAQLNEQCRGYPFGAIVSSELANAVPRFAKHCKDSQVKQQKKDAIGAAGPSSQQIGTHGTLANPFSADLEADTHPRSMGYRRIIRTAFMLANILWNADPKFLPKSLSTQLGSLFSTALAEAEVAWSICLGEDDMSSPDPPPNSILRAAVRQAEEVAEQVKTLLSTTPKSLAAPSSPRGTASGASAAQEQPGWVDQVSKLHTALTEFAKKTKRRLVQRQSAPSSRNLAGSSSSSGSSAPSPAAEESAAPAAARRVRGTITQTPSTATLTPPSSSARQLPSTDSDQGTSSSSAAAPSGGAGGDAASAAERDREKEREARRMERMASRRAARENNIEPK